MELQDVAKFLINPLLYVFAGLVAMLFAVKRARKIAILILLYTYLASIPYTAKLLAGMWSVPDSYDPQKKYDAVVVLSGVINLWWYADNAGSGEFFYLPDDFLPTAPTFDRLLAGIYFVKTGHARKLLMGDWVIESAGKGVKSFSEGEKIKNYILSRGLREDQTVFYAKIHRTLEEARGVREYAGKNGAQKILLVTSQMHIRRAVALLKKQGIAVDTFAVNRRGAGGAHWRSFIPSTGGIEGITDFLYEFVGYAGYMLRGDL
jgi:uncharacterized SAM-binding protein YcdF (DUF218 family)